MLSIDTNILFYAANPAAPLHRRAVDCLRGRAKDEAVVISEFVLAELYRLLRSPAVNPYPLTAPEALVLVESYRRHPRWRVAGFPPESRALHDQLWALAAAPGFAFRRLCDVRTALTLLRYGVTEFATVNTSDFDGIGFRRVWNPLAEEMRQ
jgi:predicted nucleic acid-binding protein